MYTIFVDYHHLKGQRQSADRATAERLPWLRRITISLDVSEIRVERHTETSATPENKAAMGRRGAIDSLIDWTAAVVYHSNVLYMPRKASTPTYLCFVQAESLWTSTEGIHGGKLPTTPPQINVEQWCVLFV